MEREHWEELEAQVEDHGFESVCFELQTDSGNGEVIVTDVMFEDGRIKVSLA